MGIKFIQKIIDKIRGKNSIKYYIITNGINNIVECSEKDKKILRINIVGNNNFVNIKTLSKFCNGIISINIFGNNCKINIDENFYVSQTFNILIGQNHPCFGKVNNSILNIGKNVTMEQVEYITYNSNVFCEIKDQCMFAYGISLYNTDAHPVFEKDSRKIINKVKGIEIGKHSWIGRGVSILKNSIVPDNSIIGMNAVFSGGGKMQPYCAFAGNPARVIKENVDWDGNGNKYGYIENKV